MQTKQTAVEWLKKNLIINGSGATTTFPELFTQAKAMEKEQIISAYAQGVLDEGGLMDDLFEDAILYFQENYGI